MVVDVIIPVLNEEKAIYRVIKEIPYDFVRYIVVCDNGSKDRTADIAIYFGVEVLIEYRRGYGNACLRGVNWYQKLAPFEWPDVLVFMDGDYSDIPSEMINLVKPIEEGRADFVIGSRVLGNAQPGSLTPVQRFGNFLATRLIKWFYGVQYTDLGPFRAIRLQTIREMNMCDRNYGWTVEMQIKAAKMKVPTLEIPVSYRRRIGKSKISGTIVGSVKAGWKIIYTIFKHL